MYIFYHEFDSTSSGTAVVILNLVRGLILKQQKVLLIACVNGDLHNNLRDLNPDLLKVINNDRDSIERNIDMISNEDIIITTHYYSIFKIFKKANPRIIFYCVNITSLPAANLYFKGINIKSLTKKLVKYISNSGGLLFIDEYALEENKRLLNVSITAPAFLPIPIDVPLTNLWANREKTPGQLSFTYVGRAVDWKIFPMRKVLKDASMLNAISEKKIIFHIVTDNKNEFRQKIADVCSDSVEIYFHENLSQKQLSVFLLENSSVHFAMGTASLDGAKLGIPTVLLDFSFQEFPANYCYNFLYTTKGNTVGTWIKKGMRFQGHTFQELIELTKSEKKMLELSQFSYEYVKNDHQLSDITDKLIEFSSYCKTYLREISKFLGRYWLS